MSKKTLAERRAAKASSRPERSVQLCLAPHLVAEVQALTAELDELQSHVDAAPGAGAGENGPPTRMVSRPDPAIEAMKARIDEIKARLVELLAEMAEDEGDLRLRGIDDGEWRRWTNEHPAREEGEPGYKRDQAVTKGYCNADDLIDNLANYAYSWDDEPLVEGDWAILADSIAGADKKALATAVVAMHETAVDFPSWRRALSLTLEQGAGSSSPAASASRNDDSSAGNPPSDTSTSTPTGT